MMLPEIMSQKLRVPKGKTQVPGKGDPGCQHAKGQPTAPGWSFTWCFRRQAKIGHQWHNDQK